MPKERKYGSVRIPAKLAEKAEEAIRELDLGYTDLTSFVLDAIREHLRRLGYLK